MEWEWQGGAGGESLDDLIDGVDCTGINPISGTGGITVISTPVKYGTGALQIPSGSVGNATILEGALNTCITCVQAWVNYDGNPTAAGAIFWMSSESPKRAYALQVGTDRRVRIVDHDGTYHRLVPLSPWSVGTLGNGAYTHLVWFIDPLTLGTNHVWHTVLIDQVPQILWDCGVAPNGMNPGENAYIYLGTGGIDIGVDLRIDDVCAATSTSKADAPHLTAVPIGTVDAQHPAGAGDHADWLAVPGSGEERYEDWDDATGNDGNTTYLGGFEVSQVQDSAMESLATLGWGESAAVLRAPVWSGVIKSSADGEEKWLANTHCNLANDENVLLPGTTWVGDLHSLTKTSGSWARADAGTITAGAATGAGSMALDFSITLVMLQWLISEGSLPLTPAPMITQGSII